MTLMPRGLLQDAPAPRTLAQAKANLAAKGMATPTMSLDEFARIIMESNPGFKLQEDQKKALEMFEACPPGTRIFLP